ncbi:uncharacterized protein MELLADRAFT_59888 [Melampsora larici-populina 98AG31]|uniref:Uncharacterized protein n=1 Tax=Melampsora larici-populina (strain 98AG31 / pathotype 3-4-7) TaxID=747676 RepID=F4R960_MELLP|nr:uncharacterized protein MELLADRAFT_59888 [Melampsora larici-populina 98AG31]EGG11209.1 hypothetical protein MELLADRAFT_59888 [Melampsora larici-populina 98AG31]
MSSHPYNTRLSARKRMLGELQDDTVEGSPTRATQGRTKRRRKNLSAKNKCSSMPGSDLASRCAFSPDVASITTSSEVHQSQFISSGAAPKIPSEWPSPSRIDVFESKKLKSIEVSNGLQSQNDPREHWDPALRSPQINHLNNTTKSPQNGSRDLPECDTESSSSFDASILIPAPSPDQLENSLVGTDQETEEQSLISRDEESNVELNQDDHQEEESTSSSLNRFWRFFFF